MIEITRIHSTPYLTIGVVKTYKDSMCSFIGFSLELGWKDNVPNISCIPPGFYKYTEYYSNKFRSICLRLLEVPERTGIVIHPGNTTDDTQGCILVGEYIHHDKLYNSRLTLSRLLNHDGFLLIR